VLGALAGSEWSTRQHALIGIGFCGGLTTFSTFSVEAVELLQGRRGVAATGYVLFSCAAGVGAASLGYSLG
jgi:CrcB protein